MDILLLVLEKCNFQDSVCTPLGNSRNDIFLHTCPPHTAILVSHVAPVTPLYTPDLHTAFVTALRTTRLACPIVCIMILKIVLNCMNCADPCQATDERDSH